MIFNVHDRINEITSVRKLKTYTSLTQIGLSVDTVTSPDTITLALGRNAMLVMQTNNAEALTLYGKGIVPIKFGGTLTVVNKGGRSEYTYTHSSGFDYRRILDGYIDSSPLTWKPWKKVDMYIELTGTLAAGETTLTFTNDAITTDSTFDFYTSIYGVSPTNVTVATGSITLRFNAQETDMSVEVRVM